MQAMTASLIPPREKWGALRWLALVLGTALVLDSVWLATVKVTHFGVIVPACIGLAMAALALVWPRWQVWVQARRWRIWGWHLALAGFAVWLLSLLAFFAFMQAQKPVAGAGFEPAAIIVLGSSTPNAKPSPTLAQRLDLAGQLAIQHSRAAVVVSGGADFRQDIPEARVMADYLTAHGLDGSRIALEDRSTSTYENLLFSARLLEGRGIGRDSPMLLVTSDFHTARAGWIAARAGWSNVQAAGAPTPLYMRYNAWTREYFACLSGWLLGEY
ncbi:YdcF family protein [Polaromonas sp.]|uniref:YdcF family protein n=1 Tax=Polaromonas sp. TaxID=1869339 RepID=UPI003265A9E9